MNIPAHIPNLQYPQIMSSPEEISTYLQGLQKELMEYFQLGLEDTYLTITTVDLDDLANTSLADPGADRIVFWDDGAGVYTWLTANTGLAISGTDLNLSHLGLEGLADPGADRIFFWDESENAAKWLAPDGTTIEISGTTLQVIGSGVEIPDQNVLLDEIGSATYDDLNDHLNNTQSAGKISGGALTDSGSGEIDVAAGTGIIKTTNSAWGANVQFDWSAASNVALTDNSMNYIYIDYNSGTPQVGVTTDRSTIHFTDQIGLGRAYRSGTSLEIMTGGVQIQDVSYRIHKRFANVDGFIHGSGAATSMTGLKVAVTTGTYFFGITQFTSGAIDTNVADTFTYIYSDGGAGWTEVAAQTDVDNLQYDDGDGVLGSLTVNRYGVHWLYLVAGTSDYYVVYGTGDYKLNEAQETTSPASLPGYLSNMGFLIARIIIKQNAATKTSIGAPWDTSLVGSGVTDHGDLAGLSDDDHAQYLLVDGSRELSADWDTGNARKITTKGLKLWDSNNTHTLELIHSPDEPGDATLSFNVMSGNRQLIFYEDFIIGNGAGGTLTFSQAGKALTVEDTTNVNQDLTTDASPTFADLTLSVPVNIYTLSHDSFADFVAAEHVSLPNTIAAALSDHNLAAHTALGLFDQHSDVDHDQTTNFVANKHIDWTGASNNFLTTGTLGTGGPLTITQNSDTVVLSHNGADAYMKWNDGVLRLMTDEGANTTTVVRLYGKGTGYSEIRCYDQANTTRVGFLSISDWGYIDVTGVATGLALRLGAVSKAIVYPTYFHSTGYINSVGGYRDNGTAGVDGTFVDNNANTVTVSGGIITALT